MGADVGLGQGGRGGGVEKTSDSGSVFKTKEFAYRLDSEV